MTNYEKYKNEFIELLATASGACDKIYGLRTNKKTCPLRSGTEGCKECERLNKQWLNEEAKEFDPYKLKEGDKIVMRKRGYNEFSEFEVVCNQFSVCWLRLMDYENDKPKSDKDFLISYNRLMSEYDVKEVVRE